MRVLLDTNALLWLLQDDTRLMPKARKVIENSSEISVSEASLWEISIKVSIGKLKPIAELMDTIRSLGFRRLNIRDKDLRVYESLPLIHRDPFDRILVAQALSDDIPLVTNDSRLIEYGIKIVATEAA